MSEGQQKLRALLLALAGDDEIKRKSVEDFLAEFDIGIIAKDRVGELS